LKTETKEKIITEGSEGNCLWLLSAKKELHTAMNLIKWECW
jgi:hypothetical protein